MPIHFVAHTPQQAAKWEDIARTHPGRILETLEMGPVAKPTNKWGDTPLVCAPSFTVIHITHTFLRTCLRAGQLPPHSQGKALQRGTDSRTLALQSSCAMVSYGQSSTSPCSRACQTKHKRQLLDRYALACFIYHPSQRNAITPGHLGSLHSPRCDMPCPLLHVQEAESLRAQVFQHSQAAMASTHATRMPCLYPIIRALTYQYEDLGEPTKRPSPRVYSRHGEGSRSQDRRTTRIYRCIIHEVGFKLLGPFSSHEARPVS